MKRINCINTTKIPGKLTAQKQIENREKEFYEKSSEKKC